MLPIQDDQRWWRACQLKLSRRSLARELQKTAMPCHAIYSLNLLSSTLGRLETCLIDNEQRAKLTSRSQLSLILLVTRSL